MEQKYKSLWNEFKTIHLENTKIFSRELRTYADFYQRLYHCPMLILLWVNSQWNSEICRILSPNWIFTKNSNLHVSILIWMADVFDRFNHNLATGKSLILMRFFRSFEHVKITHYKTVDISFFFSFVEENPILSVYNWRIKLEIVPGFCSNLRALPSFRNEERKICLHASSTRTIQSNYKSKLEWIWNFTTKCMVVC